MDKHNATVNHDGACRGMTRSPVNRVGDTALDTGKASAHCGGNIRAVYTRENKPRITQSAAYVSRELSHLYEHGLSKELVRGLRKPRLTVARVANWVNN